MPELYEHLNPMPVEAAVQMELELPDTQSQADTDNPAEELCVADCVADCAPPAAPWQT